MASYLGCDRNLCLHRQIKTNHTIATTYTTNTINSLTDSEMLRSPTRHQRQLEMDSSEQVWPDETIVVLPETPRVRLSPRRQMNPQSPSWPPGYMGETIRMYHDPEDQEETVNFTMNPDFIESTIPSFKFS